MSRVVIHNHLARDDTGKLSHAEVNYGRSTGKDRCEVCKNVRLGPYCIFVQSPISLSGWCKLFERATDAK